MTGTSNRRTRPTRIAVILASCVLFLAGCAGENGETEPEVDRTLQEARSVNQSRHVAERFEAHPLVMDDPDGFATCQLFYPSSEVLVLSDDTPAAQLRAASLAVVVHAPMLIYRSERHADVIREIERMNTHTVFAVGDVPVLGYTQQLKVIKDPGGKEALEKATALEFSERDVSSPEDAAEAVAGLMDGDPVWLRATYGPDQHVYSDAEAGVVPVRSRQDAEMAPQVIALAESPLPALATARAFGASVYVTDDPDPRASELTLVLTAGLAERPLVALGKAFGTSEELAQRIIDAEASVAPGDLNNVSSLPQAPD